MTLNPSASPARRCYTAAAFCVFKGKIILIKHKKLGIWLAPGGHIEPPELPHQGALRELFEETGLRGHLITAYPTPVATHSENLPLPFSINLHWISADNYHQRLSSDHPELPHQTRLWPKGCEQHLTFNYLVKAHHQTKPEFNAQETDAVRWFSLTEIKSLSTRDDIKIEIMTAIQRLHAYETHP